MNPVRFAETCVFRVFLPSPIYFPLPLGKPSRTRRRRRIRQRTEVRGIFAPCHAVTLVKQPTLIRMPRIIQLSEYDVQKKAIRAFLGARMLDLSPLKS